ncbi:UbiX family flavin prenyltransferase [Desulforhopalus singaporensis]|uniref:Flavin prenyltransferase UbiX n=1 Tax=Desulforhopalus singaporensis TaxID=91360 RepID=A0A1H0KU21_9BACT|nr:UbiX family flavin prenyltransferase [Desulforhopalus singaporensis]SDO59504.1 3-octaprenyl-4hydroxybenzoate decarboxylase [Desulforhopalus singaporensis]
MDGLIQEKHLHHRKITVGITGASGAVYGIRAVEILNSLGVETHLVISGAAEITIAHETGRTIESVRGLATRRYDNKDIGATIASGSYGIDGMIIAPCSMRTLGAIANSLSDNLIVRAADVMLKEGKPLVLVVRETPLHRGHLRLMDLAALSGAIIFPPVPALYNKPLTIEEMIDQSVYRFLHRIGIETPGRKSWQGF